MRGRGKLKSLLAEVKAIRVDRLDGFADRAKVDAAALVKKGLVREGYRIKIVDGGKLSRTLTVKVPVTAGAEKKIKAAGGTIEK